MAVKNLHSFVFICGQCPSSRWTSGARAQDGTLKPETASGTGIPDLDPTLPPPLPGLDIPIVMPGFFVIPTRPGIRVGARPSFRSRTQCCPPQPIHACGDRGRSSSWAGVSWPKDDEHESNDGSWNASGNARSATATAPAPPMYDSASSFAL